MYFSSLAGLSFALLYSITLVWLLKRFASSSFVAEVKLYFEKVLVLFAFFKLRAKKTSRRPIPHKTPSTLVAYRLQGQQTTRLNLKMKSNFEKKLKFHNI